MTSVEGSGNVIKVASFNVNSLRARIGNLLTWLRTAKPDVVLLQEIKCLETDLPKLEIEDLGYNFEAVGQKSYNGVAILSKHPFMVEARRLPGGEGDDHARYIEAVIDDTSLDLLAGAEVDFVEDLVGSAFQVKNPNATSSCGCGSSFAVA